MDISRHLSRIGTGLRLQGRVRAVPARLEGKSAPFIQLKAASLLNGKNRRRLGAAFLLILSFVLGFWAYSESVHEGARQWERSHPPSLKAWRMVLAVHGFIEEKEPSRAQKVARTLPSLMDSEPSVWVSRDLNWVSVLNDPQASEPLHLFCRNCKAPPAAWESSGAGWTAFDSLSARLEEVSRTGSGPARVAAQEPADPREIRY